jgi:hypothetical protein|uniref:Uncharacterized protein n=2 Tax=Picea TaxID=3328 RepID=A0A6B9XVE1_PICSI|nr:hypothetical protein Q903MT_gene4248 [Picea sitchensis]
MTEGKFNMTEGSKFDDEWMLALMGLPLPYNLSAGWMGTT